MNALARSLTAKQLLEWEAYADLEPFDEGREDYRAASIVAMIFNMAVAVKDRRPIADFLLKFEDDKEASEKRRPQTFEEQIAIAKIMVAASQKVRD